MAMAIVAGLVARGVDGRPDLPELDETDWRAHVVLDFAMAVAPAPDGGVWVGTDSGELIRWDADGYERHAPDGLSGRPVTEVAMDDDGMVWAASFHFPPPDDERWRWCPVRRRALDRLGGGRRRVGVGAGRLAGG